MSVRSSDGRAPTPPQKRSRTSASGSAASGSASSSRATTPVNKPLPPSSSSLATLATKKPGGLRVDTAESALQCMTCGGMSANRSDFMACCHCPNVFHAKCANLPSVPEEGDIFCRWSCFTDFHKAAIATAAAAATQRSESDFPQLAVQIQLLLRDQTASAPRHTLPVHYHTTAMSTSNGTGSSNGRRFVSRPVTTAADERHGGDRSSRRPSDMGDSTSYTRYRTSANDRAGRTARRSDRSASPSPTRAASSYSSRRGASRVSPNTVGALEPDFSRSVGRAGAFGPAESSAAAVRSSSHSAIRAEPISGAASLAYAHAPHDIDDDLASDGGSRSAAYRASSAAHWPLDGAIRSRTSFGSASGTGGGPRGRYRSSHAASAASSSEREQRSRVASNGKAMRYASASGPPQVPSSAASGASSTGPSASVRPLSHAKEADVPWLNPSAFPTGMHERFACHADDLNRVFRIDLTPAFADKATHLYQSEIDFFFRCFESSDVSLVVKGMASELNACMWTWPFVLESVGADACFAFEHFQYTRASRDGASQSSSSSSDLEYVGELKLSLGAYSQYLDKFLSLPVGKDAIVLDDHTKKEPVTMLANDNVIALHSLVVAQSCAKLYSDLKNSFQWDVFAGGIHCLLQYLPESCRSDKFASPVFHFTFPGARGALCDPGNGTTDTAYQVLTGSLELVIFERMEPRHRDEFARILRRAGYHVEKKPMLQEAHLRALSSAGFVWTTVKIHDGEFIHINKGRMHFWRAVSRIAPTSAATVPRSVLANEPCVFLSWEWVYQGVSQRGISTECWFAMKNASLCSSGWAFDPRRAIIEAAKTGVATVRSGQFLIARRSALSHALSFASGSIASAAARMLDAGAVSQRQMQMVLFLESILQCLKTIVDDEYDLALAKDDSEVFGKRFDGEAMWKVVDADLVTSRVHDPSAYACGVCGLELTNIYKQCLGCTAYASTCQPNMSYKLFRLCLRCHAHPKHHHFKPRVLHGYFGKLLSCEGHTGAPQSALDPNFFECACAPSLPCGYCGGCQSCSCVCHTQFQTRFRFASPESLDRLRFDVEEVVKFHKQAAVVAR